MLLRKIILCNKWLQRHNETDFPGSYPGSTAYSYIKVRNPSAFLNFTYYVYKK